MARRFGKKKRAGLDCQHPKTEILAAAVEFVGDVPAEHACPHDDDVKRIAAVVDYLGPGAAQRAAENVVGECRLLDINENLRIRIKAGFITSFMSSLNMLFAVQQKA